MAKYLVETKSEKLISVFIKSRNRPEQLAACIQSFIDTVDDMSRIELLVRIDNDDYNTWSKMDIIPDMHNGKHIPLKITKGPRFGGYVDIWRMDNQLQEIATGEFSFGFNDDAVIETQGWDSIIAEYSGQSCIIKSDYLMYDNHGNTLTGDQFTAQENIFPIVHRTIPDALGFFAIHEATDKMFDLICELDPNLLVRENRIKSTHHQGAGEHVLDGLPPTDPNGIYSPKNIKRINAMIIDIHTYLRKLGVELNG